MWKLAFVILALTCSCFANDSDPDNTDNCNMDNGGSVAPVRPFRPIMPPVITPVAVPTKEDIVRMMDENKDGHIQGQVYNYATHEETKDGVQTVHSKGDLINYHDGEINEDKFEN